MYLSKLNEIQKENFLDLAINLSTADGDFSDKEKVALGLLCDEMSIKKRYIAINSTETVVSDFTNNADIKIRRIVVLELLGIALADGYFASCEKDMIMKLAHSFGICKEDFEEVSKTIIDLYDIYKKLNGFVDKQ